MNLNTVMVYNSRRSDRVWKKDETAALITLYESEPCLYDNNDPMYFNQDERNKAYERIHQIMLRIRPYCQLSHIKSRIKFLRSHYASERLRKDVTIKSGIYTEEAYKPKLWCFALLQFLDDLVPAVKNSELKEIEEEMNRMKGDEQNENFTTHSRKYYHQSNKEEMNRMKGEEQNENFTTHSRRDYHQSNKDITESLNGIHKNSEDDTLNNEGSCKKKRKLNLISEVSEKERNVAENLSVSESLEREDIFGQYVASEMKILRDNPLLYLQTKQAILEILTCANFEFINPE